MKQIFIILLSVSFLTIQAQSLESIESFNKERLEINKRGMLVLGSWATANLAWGIVGATQTEGATQAFHQMNAGWNAVNLLIAGAGYWSSRKAKTSLSLAETFAEQKKMEQILLFNAGLDIAYITSGLLMMEYARRGENSNQWMGFGRSLILQGGFLFAFDIAMALIHQKHWKRFQPIVGTGFYAPGKPSLTFGLAIR
jgi:urease gamma subunit